MSRIAVIGAGAWGTALAIVLGRRGGHAVRLWAYEQEVVASILARRTNDLFLPEASIPATVTVTDSLTDALNGAEIVLSVMPSHHVRRLFTQMLPHLSDDMVFVSATKGVEDQTYLRMTEVIEEVVTPRFSPRLVAVSGPTFAKEVAKGDPTAITAASSDEDLARTVQHEFSDPRFRVYTNRDVVGVELGGALKNVIAIAAGICDGLELGHNSVAALVTRGLAEITRLSLACGGHIETMAGLAGLGDLVLTCTGGLSRNRTVGVELGKGRKLADIIAGMRGMVAEGVLTTNAAIGLANKHGVEMPITQQMHAILHQGKSPSDAIRELMSRPSTTEVWL
ncbi:glycerol 3-phosphate dehydrogenase (NAD(P)+) [Candidatus Koribacter versatilis Ellin345]|uniref:Glycerol-3-phosphate dehydrogenase [NAD(P)+] n=1 Tax=Koribacter versatilis (strain Ellin345) TaxID=204669 RepID=GPDA_KORVE|nr:NAD(P)H-dependent glycerol-3-phosphate dehydrogenase [Candidatus Koribacter versatilis]Q1IPR2.1 RecName: Full=Glycerol-3-phosphate dehydrogenase [NAD(P)+]; AltName: Full=NAD(P)H-dependent glycerol-3-phosphate dehydrogenase [Candidatus Koribacter versatilis Ellin345]ABF41138.1 glycerol 3-phosphate dehydrogenase (NAD(P)+) [Candidatus Koribacter versatilis Ellin345]